MAYNPEHFEDKIRAVKQLTDRVEKTSPYCDFVYYTSSRDSSLKLAMRIDKPAVPGRILVQTHGWHMSAVEYAPAEAPGDSPFLTLSVDMRCRAFSDGKPDCNGYELQDVIDAVNYARERYKEYISDPDIVYFEAGSGGGGNALAIAGKFPDFFAAVNALYCMSDYGMWYRNDSDGEFRDEMDIWVGKDPDLDPMAYAARSGLSLVRNLYSPLFIAHGELDRRVPVYHSHLYLAAAEAAGKAGLIDYYEMKGVGTESHISGASPEQKEELSRRALANLTTHSAPIQLPRKGKLLAGGYLVTKYFRVDLDSLDKIAEVEYDADARTVSVHSAVPCEYTVEWF